MKIPKGEELVSDIEDVFAIEVEHLVALKEAKETLRAIEVVWGGSISGEGRRRCRR